MRTWLNRGIYILLAIVSSIAVVLYTNVQSLSHEKEKQQVEIQVLQADLKAEKSRNIILSELNKQLDSSLVKMRDAIEKVESGKDTAIREIDSVYANKGNINESGKESLHSSSDVALGDSLNRVLSDLCERVRGSPCPNP